MLMRVVVKTSLEMLVSTEFIINGADLESAALRSDGRTWTLHFTIDLRPEVSAPQPRGPRQRLTAHASGKASTAPRPAVARP